MHVTYRTFLNLSYLFWGPYCMACGCYSDIVSDSLRPHGLRSLVGYSPWDFPGKSTRVGCHFLLQGIFPTQGLNLHSPVSNLCYCKSGCKKYPYILSHVCIPYMLTYVYVISYMCKHICRLIHWKWSCCQRVCAFDMLVKWSEVKSLSRVRLFVTPWTVAYQAPLSMGFSRQ